MSVMGPRDAYWYLYMARRHDGSLYTVISTNVERQFAQHQGDGDSGYRST